MKLDELQRLLSPSGDALVAFDAERRIVYWSQRMEDISGLCAAEVMGQPLFAFLAPGNDREFAIPQTGKRGYLDVYHAPLDEGGTIAVVRNTTEAWRIAEQIRETESRFQNMADAAPVLLWMAGTDSLCNFFNQTWLDFTGRTLEDEWGVGWAEGVYFEDLQRCMDTYVAAFNQRAPFEMIYRLRRADGEYRHLLDRGVPRYTPDGTFAGYIGSCVDITDRVQLEDELRAAVATREEFLAIAAHELRTPMTPIQLGVQGLSRQARNENVDAGLLRKIDLLDQNVTRQVRLIERMLDVSRMMHGTIPLEPREVDFAAVTHAVAAEFEDECRRSATPLQLATPETLRGVWDEERLRQIVRNLISNAVKYGRGAPIEVTLAAPATLTVRDHGVGIHPKDRERIFDRFERAVSHPGVSGFGVGLWVVRKIVSAMGGSISVESQPDEGSTFVVSLPLEAPPATR